jgi:hypothetical protein
MKFVTNRDWTQIEHQLDKNDCVVLDDFFTKTVCIALHQRMILSTAFDTDYKTYQAKDYDLNDDLTKYIVDDLLKASPRLFGEFVRAWSFVYNNEADGVGLHSDPSSFNINVWVTPDESVKDKFKNGLNIYSVKVPSNWTREQYNKNPDVLRDLIYEKPHVIYRVPYKYNRAIIFNASMPHETDSVLMHSGTQNRRVSYTMLYGIGPFKS